MPPDVDLEQKLQEALADCERPRAENADLKAKLGVEVNRPTIEDHPRCNSAAVNNHSSSEAKMALFRSLFQGREDIYALRWESNKGRSGYAPACGNEWDKILCKQTTMGSSPIFHICASLCEI
jgi:hypothetical protein